MQAEVNKCKESEGAGGLGLQNKNAACWVSIATRQEDMVKRLIEGTVER